MQPTINAERLIQRLNLLNNIGYENHNGCTRLALTDEDKMGRDLVFSWLSEASAEVYIDTIGNIYGIYPGAFYNKKIATGSHIDTVKNAGKLDGCYGVVAGIEMLQAMKDQNIQPDNPIEVIIFSNEEGVRFTPDLLGSRVIAKNISVDDALQIVDEKGNCFGNELKRIGYKGNNAPWDFIPDTFIELHIEQGPLLESIDKKIGIVEGVQGHSWWQIEITGTANHAGTTPMHLRKDAGIAAFNLIQAVTLNSEQNNIPNVATAGTLEIKPSAINVVPGFSRFTLDLRDANSNNLSKAEAFLNHEINKLIQKGFQVNVERISQADPVIFSETLCNSIEIVSKARDIDFIRMTSGASHDSQMMASVCPTAMLFVPSVKGISHNPAEYSHDIDLALGAQILADTLWALSCNTNHTLCK